MKRFLTASTLALLCGVLLAQSSERIEIGYGRDPQWAPDEKHVSYIRHDSLFVVDFPNVGKERFVHYAPIWKYYWAGDSVLAFHERWHVDTPGGKDQVHCIRKVWLDRTQELVESDSFKMFVEPGKGLSLTEFGKGTVGYGRDGYGSRSFEMLGAEASSRDTTAINPPIYVRIDTPIRGDVLLCYGNDNSCRPVSPTKLRVIHPVLAPTLDKLFCKNSNGEIVILDTLGTQFANLGRGDAPAWSPDGEYITFVKAQWGHYDLISSEICVVRYDGSDYQQLTDTPDVKEFGATFSPNSNFLLLTDGSTSLIYTIAF